MTCYLPEKHRDKPLLQLTEDDFSSCLAITNHTCANAHYIVFPNQHPDRGDNLCNEPPLLEPHPPHTETKPTSRLTPKPVDPGLTTSSSGVVVPTGVGKDPDSVTISKHVIIMFAVVIGSIVVLVVAGFCFWKRVVRCSRRNKKEVTEKPEIELSKQNNRTDSAPIPAAYESATHTSEPLLRATPAASAPVFPHHQQPAAVIPRTVAEVHRATQQKSVSLRHEPPSLPFSQVMIHNDRPPVPRNYNQTAPLHDPTVNYGDQNTPLQNVALLRQHQFAQLHGVQSPHYEAQLPQPEMLDRRERRHRSDRDSGCSVTYPELHPANLPYAQHRGLYQRQLSYDSVAYAVETEPKMFLACGNPGPAYATIHPQIPGGQLRYNEPVEFVPAYVNGQ